MLELIITIIGIAASALYIGYLAFAIAAVPLWIIALATFALMIRQLLIDLRPTAKGGPG